MHDVDPAIQLIRDAGAVADTDAASGTFELRPELRDRVLDAAARVGDDRPRRRPPRWAAVAAAVLVLGGGSLATASVLRSPQPAREEVESFAADAGISPGTAAQKLQAQRKVPALAALARRRLGDAFGGVRIDNPGDLRIKLALVADASRRTVDLARTVIADAGLRGAVDLETVPRSERSVIALQATIDRELVTVNRGAPITIDVEPDPGRGRLIIRRPKPRSATTKSQRRYLATVENRYRRAVVIREGLGKLHIGTGRLDRIPKP